MKPHVAEALDKELAFRMDRDGHGVMRVGDRLVGLTRIHQGQGAYTRAFRDDDPPNDVYAFVVQGVEDKDIAAAVHRRLPQNPHVPAVEHVGEGHFIALPTSIYRMPFYRTHPAEHHWLAELTRQKLENCADESRVDEYAPARGSYTAACARREGVSPAVVEALEALVGEAESRAYYGVEFQPRNTAVDENNNLVLLDVLYRA